MTNNNPSGNRQPYLKTMSQKRKRNVIAYYSGFWQCGNKEGTEICDSDRWGLSLVVRGLPSDAGLDLILHTPGGDGGAAEAIGNYLRGVFGTNIEVFVPFTAMSAGTIIACIAKTIHMGKYSSIGPIDPQFNGYSAGYVLEEFKQARAEILENRDSALLWRPILEQYYPSFISKCDQAIALSKEIVTEWLRTGMLEDDNGNKAKFAAAKLANYTEMKSHSRHIDMTKAKEIGLNITDMGDTKNKAIENLVLTAHTALMFDFSRTTKIKLIENHNGVRFVNTAPPTKQ